MNDQYTAFKFGGPIKMSIFKRNVAISRVHTYEENLPMLQVNLGPLMLIPGPL